MDCEKICEIMCLYLDDEMDSQTKLLFEEHIASCEKCRKELETCRRMKSKVQKGLQSIKAPEFLKKRILFNLQNSDNYRESGIDALDLIHWGSHIAQLCDSKYDLIDISVPYIKKGLEQNERCLWVISNMSVSSAIDIITKGFPNIQTRLDSGQLEIISYKDWYLFKGYFDAQAVIDSSLKKCRKAISNGYSGFRLANNAYWIDHDYWDAFIDLEELVNELLLDEKILLLCPYKQYEYTDEMIAEIESVHKYVLVKSRGTWKQKRLC